MPLGSILAPEEDLDGDGYAAWEECDDNDASIYPYAVPMGTVLIQTAMGWIVKHRVMEIRILQLVVKIKLGKTLEIFV